MSHGIIYLLVLYQYVCILFYDCLTLLLLGGTSRDSINKSVNTLVHAGGEPGGEDRHTMSNSSKVVKAKKMGIEVWSEDQWNALLRKHGKL